MRCEQSDGCSHSSDGTTQTFSWANEVYDTTLGWRFINPMMKVQYGVDSMPETAENVVDDFSINRKDQDAFALRS